MNEKPGHESTCETLKGFTVPPNDGNYGLAGTPPAAGQRAILLRAARPLVQKSGPRGNDRLGVGQARPRSQ
jgi:hypothetical protein